MSSGKHFHNVLCLSEAKGMDIIMNNVTEFLPFLVPLVISELALLAYTLYHILTHKSYKRGNRTLWLIVVIVGMQFIGPILYFLLGKEDS